MNLLNSLLNFCSDRQPLEDFLTEVVAALLREHPALLDQWLEALGIETQADRVVAQIKTQPRYSKLLYHDSGSRPDLQIRRTSDEVRDLIFVESKVASSENPNQLSRYADHLKAASGYHRRYLVYITRSYEPKASGDVFKSSDPSGVEFIATRWRDFHQVLRDYPVQTDLVRITLEFMEHHGMANDNYFSPEGIIALRNYGLVTRFLENVFESHEPQRFKAAVKQFGEIDGKTQQSNNLKQGDVYWHSGVWNKTLQLWFGMGIALKESSSDPYPQMVVTNSLKSISSLLPEYQIILRQAASEFGWRLTQTDEWVAIEKRQSLATIIGKENEIEAAQLFFREAVDDLEKMLEKHLKDFLSPKVP